MNPLEKAWAVLKEDPGYYEEKGRWAPNDRTSFSTEHQLPPKWEAGETREELGERHATHYLSDEQKDMSRQREMASTKDSLNRFAAADSWDDLKRPDGNFIPDRYTAEERNRGIDTAASTRRLPKEGPRQPVGFPPAEMARVQAENDAARRGLGQRSE